MRRSLDMASAQIARFIEMNPDLEIADSPLKDWIKWDSGMSVADYCAKISQGSQWGGGIEMAAVAELKKVHVLVYEQVGNNSSSFKRIGAFGSPKWKAVRILYQGGIHFDALELSNSFNTVDLNTSRDTVDVLGLRGGAFTIVGMS